MTVDDWIIVFTLLKDPLAGLNTEIAGLNTDLSASLISIASSISTLTTTLNSLGVVALQLIFLFVFVWLAYWRRTWELYLVAAILSVLVGWQLMADPTWFIYGIFAFALGLFTLIRMLMSFRKSN